MKISFSKVVIVKMDIGLLMCTALLFSVSNATVSYYSKLTCVIPTLTTTEELTPPLSNCPEKASRNLTFNQLINESLNFNSGMPFSSSEDVIFLEGKHVVNSTDPFLFANDIRKLRMRGHDNAVIICECNFYFYFDQINGAITIMNLLFENCAGKLGQYRPTIYFRTLSTGLITVANVRIINSHEIGQGIIVDPESTHLFKVTLCNSFFSTGSTGFYSSGFISMNYRNRIDPKGSIQISNTIFLASCIKLHTSDVLYTIKNATFTECKCSPVLSFQGKTKRETATLQDIQVSGSTSSSIIEVTKFSVILEGTIVFRHNTGTLILHLGSNLIINGANVTFFSNKQAATILLVSNSIVNINHESRVVFQDNHGQNCGGITLMNSSLVLFGNSTVDFINNVGNKGGALSLYRGYVIRFATLEGNIVHDSVAIKLTFVFNSALYGGAIYVEDRDYIDPFSHNFS